MKIDIFPTPIFVGNIDCDKIIFKQEGPIFKTWESKTPSTKRMSADNILEPKSFEYLMDVIHKLIEPYIKREFTMKPSPMWTNKYEIGDYQESHVHKGTFSYCIYKKITKSQTIFYRPDRNYVDAILGESDPRLMELYPTEYQPELRENQIVVFPAFLEHMVGKFDEAAETMSGNILIKYTQRSDHSGLIQTWLNK
jgi:hypothetical protein